jgi:hypothetical protein
MPSYEDVATGAGNLQAMTGLTVEEFQARFLYVEQSFAAYMPDHAIDGQPRTVRRYSPYDTCP